MKKSVWFPLICSILLTVGCNSLFFDDGVTEIGWDNADWPTFKTTNDNHVVEVRQGDIVWFGMSNAYKDYRMEQHSTWLNALVDIAYNGKGWESKRAQEALEEFGIDAEEYIKDSEAEE